VLDLYWPQCTFDRPMVLFNAIIQILILMNLDIRAFVIIAVIDAGSVGYAFVDIDFYPLNI
jgi:hypothetical protein